MKKLNAVPFSESATSEKPDILQGKTPEQFLKSKYIRGCIFGLDCLQREGVYRISGWSFNFRPFMRKFVVKQYGHWSEMWGPNKTSIRLSTFGTVDQIVELPKDFED